MYKKLTIEDFKKVAAARGGKCLSEVYGSNGRSKLEWKCSEGHVWWTAPRNVQRGSWCPTCATLKPSSRKLHFTEKQIKDMIHLRFLQAKSYNEIAKKYKCTAPTIARVLKENINVDNNSE